MTSKPLLAHLFEQALRVQGELSRLTLAGVLLDTLHCYTGGLPADGSDEVGSKLFEDCQAVQDFENFLDKGFDRERNRVAAVGLVMGIMLLCFR